MRATVTIEELPPPTPARAPSSETRPLGRMLIDDGVI